jgi:autotransporter-associated beta strand protein
MAGAKAPTCDVSGRHSSVPRPAVGLVSRSVFRGRHFLCSKAAMFTLALCACGSGAQAQSAMWSASPSSNVWNTASNWVEGVVPTNTATFGASSITAIQFLPSAATQIETLQFNPGAPAYTFSDFPPFFTSIRITGAGIVNNSSNPPTFIVGSQENLLFLNASTAGNAIIITNAGGITGFENSATGGNARFVTNAGGAFDITSLSNGGMTAGSIEGAGSFFLGFNQLTVGSNNLSTEVSGVISGAGGSLVKVGTGTLTLSGANTYTGPTTISDGAINLTGSLVSPVTVEQAGTLGSTGTVFNTVTNAGTVEPGLGLPIGLFGNLTVNNYVGAGGILALRTFLGADNSPSDQLTINGGTATGNTRINITNVGGPGVQTTANGILVVNAINGATTAPGAFTLGNAELRAGAFDYRLFQGGLNGSDPNDWFLRSTFIESPPPRLEPIIGPELATDAALTLLAGDALQVSDRLDLPFKHCDTLTQHRDVIGQAACLIHYEIGRGFGQPFYLILNFFLAIVPRPNLNIDQRVGEQAGLSIVENVVFPDVPEPLSLLFRVVLFRVVDHLAVVYGLTDDAAVAHVPPIPQSRRSAPARCGHDRKFHLLKDSYC